MTLGTYPQLGLADARIKRDFGGNFDEQVNDTRTKLDEANIKLLQRFLKEGDWVDVSQGPAMLGNAAQRGYLQQSAHLRY